MSAPKVESISKVNVLGEGPHWESAAQVLYYVDIKKSEIHRYNPTTRKETTVKIDGGMVSLIVPIKDKKNQFLISVGRDFCVMTWDGAANKPESVEHIATVDSEDGKRENRLNDGKADPTGRLWAGTMGPEIGPCSFVPKNGSLFTLSKDRKTTIHLTGITCSNGLAWTADNKTMYYIDSFEYRVDAFDFNAEKGQATNRRTAFDFKANNTKGVPDGMAIDTEGKLWVACYDGNQVIRVDPTSGKLLTSIAIPAPKVTSVVFGGANLDELYVTTASVDMTTEDFKKYPSAGCSFRVTGVGARGLPGQEVIL